MSSKRNSIATIVTPDHLYKALTLRNSLVRFMALDFHILLTVRTKDEICGFRDSNTFEDVHYHCLGDVYRPQEINALEEKYGENSDGVRWTSKSAFLRHLLESCGYDAVIYADSDTYFVGDYAFLFDLLVEHSIILTPHWRPIEPETDRIQYFCNFTDGLYNAGFVGASKGGLDALSWWHDRCRHRCEINHSYGLYVDQKYLDVLPIYFENVHIIKHRGCNVAEWNRRFLQRRHFDGHVRVDEKWHLVFVHFTQLTLQYIQDGKDDALLRVMAEYQNELALAKKIADEIFHRSGFKSFTAHSAGRGMKRVAQ